MYTTKAIKQLFHNTYTWLPDILSKLEGRVSLFLFCVSPYFSIQSLFYYAKRKFVFCLFPMPINIILIVFITLQSHSTTSNIHTMRHIKWNYFCSKIGKSMMFMLFHDFVVWVDEWINCIKFIIILYKT